MRDTTESLSSVDPLPTPSGPHAVGRMSYDWVDPNRAETYAVDASCRRELVVWLWYPAEPVSHPPAPYLPGEWASTLETFGIPAVGLRAHSVQEARPVAAEGGWPVLVLSPSGMPPLLLSSLAEELASHGYVVVGVNHTFEPPVTVFDDGRVVAANPAAAAGAMGPQSGSHDEAFAARGVVCATKAADLAFVADELSRRVGASESQLEGLLDLDRLGALGHSFGGNAALEWCRTDPRCRAAVNLDGALWTEVGRSGLERPALQILAEHREFDVSPEEAVKIGMAPNREWFVAEKTITFGGWRTVHEHAHPGYTVRVAGATHISFSDIPFLPGAATSLVAPMIATTTIDAERMWRVTSDLTLAFFARHLGASDEPLLDEPDRCYPELAVGPA